MNKELLAHRAWTIQTKLNYGFDSVAYITTTKSYDRLSTSSAWSRCQALRNVINKSIKTVKIVNNNSHYSHSLRVYFNISDKEACDVLLNLVSKNAHHYELLEVKTPKNQAHLDMINNKEITQVIRNKLYHNQFVYSVKIHMEREDKQLQLQMWNSARTKARFQKTSTMNKWFSDAMQDAKTTVWYDEVQLFTNDISPLVMFRLTFDVKSCKIKEAILLGQEDNEYEHEHEHETGILM
jgi:hypothetical protein